MYRSLPLSRQSARPAGNVARQPVVRRSLLVLPVLLALLGAPLDAADVDDNGIINVADVYYLYTFLLASGPPPPAPFPAAGDDPTPDSLEGCAGS